MLSIILIVLKMGNKKSRSNPQDSIDQDPSQTPPWKNYIYSEMPKMKEKYPKSDWPDYIYEKTLNFNSSAYRKFRKQMDKV